MHGAGLYDSAPDPDVVGIAIIGIVFIKSAEFWKLFLKRNMLFLNKATILEKSITETPP